MRYYSLQLALYKQIVLFVCILVKLFVRVIGGSSNLTTSQGV